MKRTKRRRIYREIGLTIVELMIVLTIIAAIMGLIAYNMTGVIDDADQRLARIEVEQLTRMVESYYVRSTPRAYPDSLEDLTLGPDALTEDIPLDPWGNNYVYRQTAEGFEVFSAGPDQQAGTSDVVANGGD